MAKKKNNGGDDPNPFNLKDPFGVNALYKQAPVVNKKVPVSEKKPFREFTVTDSNKGTKSRDSGKTPYYDNIKTIKGFIQKDLNNAIDKYNFLTSVKKTQKSFDDAKNILFEDVYEAAPYLATDLAMTLKEAGIPTFLESVQKYDVTKDAEIYQQILSKYGNPRVVDRESSPLANFTNSNHALGDKIYVRGTHSILDEAAHTVQYRDKGFLPSMVRLGGDILKSVVRPKELVDYGLNEIGAPSHTLTYAIPGALEYEAHEEIAPKIKLDHLTTASDFFMEDQKIKKYKNGGMVTSIYSNDPTAYQNDILKRIYSTIDLAGNNGSSNRSPYAPSATGVTEPIDPLAISPLSTPEREKPTISTPTYRLNTPKTPRQGVDPFALTSGIGALGSVVANTGRPNALMGAASGALSGAAFGPIGAAVGGLIGLASTGINRSNYEDRVVQEQKQRIKAATVFGTDIGTYEIGGNIQGPPNGLNPVQLEKNEMISSPDGGIFKAKAKKTHKQMDKDEVTDLLPTNTLVASNSKNKAISSKAADEVLLGYEIVEYKEGEATGPPKERNLGEIMTKKKMTPAEMLAAIRRKYPTNDDVEYDPFLTKANKANLQARLPYVNAVAQLSAK